MRKAAALIWLRLNAVCLQESSRAIPSTIWNTGGEMRRLLPHWPTLVSRGACGLPMSMTLTRNLLFIGASLFALVVTVNMLKSKPQPVVQTLSAGEVAPSGLKNPAEEINGKNLPP